MKITKMECAEHLLDVAADVYRKHGSCPAVVHLAGAAAEMASTITKWRAIYPQDEGQGFLDWIAQEAPDIAKDINLMRNWIKHADRDPDTAMEWHARRPRGGIAANAAEFLLFTTALEIANVNGKTSDTTYKVAHVLLPRAPELSKRISKLEDDLR